MPLLPFHNLLVYAFTLWFSFYLLVRHSQYMGIRFAGMGLLAYAVGLALYMITPFAPQVSLWNSLFLLLPTAFWYGAITHLDRHETGTSFTVAWITGLAIVTGMLIAFGFVPFIIAPIGAAIVLIIALIGFWRGRRSGDSKENTSIVAIFTATIFFGLGIGTFLLPAGIFPADLTILALGFDLALLGIGIAALDAYHEGESLRSDFTRSLIASMLTAIIFGGQVVMFIAIEQTVTLGLMVLLIAIISVAIAFQTLYEGMQNMFDRLALPQEIQKERTELRQAVDAISRLDRGIDWTRIDEAEFTRLTRRALSYIGDLGKLASSPLTQLPMIDEAISGKPDTILERATALKSLLIENILRLKPRDTNEDFGITDEWRYYNALYFPYVVGLKPFSRRATHDDLLDDTSAQALDWFKTYIPERTLYNWQNTAAGLIAHSLWEQLHTSS